MLTQHTSKQLQFTANPLLKSETVKTVDVEDIAAPTVFIRPKVLNRRELRELRAKQTAVQAIAGLTHDNEIYGFTKGQFSLLQLLESAMETTGPVELVISTWTAARHEIQRLQELQRLGSILSSKWLVDLTFARRDPEAANQIRLAFGADAIRVAQTHSKFALFTNERWKLVLRTSMNLNMNPRFEDFTISHDPELHAFLTRIVTDIWTRQRRDLADRTTRDAQRFFREEM